MLIIFGDPMTGALGSNEAKGVKLAGNEPIVTTGVDLAEVSFNVVMGVAVDTKTSDVNGVVILGVEITGEGIWRIDIVGAGVDICIGGTVNGGTGIISLPSTIVGNGVPDVNGDETLIKEGVVFGV